MAVTPVCLGYRSWGVPEFLSDSKRVAEDSRIKGSGRDCVSRVMNNRTGESLVHEVADSGEVEKTIRSSVSDAAEPSSLKSSDSLENSGAETNWG